MKWKMKSLLLKSFIGAVVAAALSSTAFAQKVNGAGASFPAPIYSQWADAYKKATGVQVNYQSIGSSAGVNQITARTVDFGASDTPLSDEKLKELGLIQFPTVIGGVVPVVNVQGVKPGELKLNGQVLADIYLGKIKQWNDPAIQAINPDLSLPATSISVAHRSDGSGTSYAFTEYLSSVSPEWKEKVGTGSSVNWPTGSGGKGNEGVAVFVMRLPNSIGYVEYAYAKQNNVSHVLLQNPAGNYVESDKASFQAAAIGVDWPKTFAQSLINTPSEKAWPISTATFILIYKQTGKPEQTAQVLKFFEWAYQHGDATAIQLDYVPFPEEVKTLIREQWGLVTDSQGQAINYR